MLLLDRALLDAEGLGHSIGQLYLQLLFLSVCREMDKSRLLRLTFSWRLALLCAPVVVFANACVEILARLAVNTCILAHWYALVFKQCT